MASDDLVWSVIGTDFCSFKLKTTKDQTFCRNEHNVTGFCSKQSCPLANSRYATLRSDPATGTIYLYIKAIERSHLPNRWWEKIKLSRNYTEALEQVDQHLQYYPKFLRHKNKQRLTRLTQVRLRIKRLAKEEERLGERLVPKLAPKVRKREEGRERKALAAAKVERGIERVLIERLKSGAYGDKPVNVEPNIWERVMKGLERQAEAVGDEDLDEGISEDGEIEYERELEGPDVEYVSDIEGESDEELEDFEDWVGRESPDEEEDDEEDEAGENDQDEEDGEDGSEEDVEALKKTLASLKRKRPSGPPPKPKKKPAKKDKGPRREIEYEIERERPLPELAR